LINIYRDPFQSGYKLKFTVRNNNGDNLVNQGGTFTCTVDWMSVGLPGKTHTFNGSFNVSLIVTGETSVDTGFFRGITPHYEVYCMIKPTFKDTDMGNNQCSARFSGK